MIFNKTFNAGVAAAAILFAGSAASAEAHNWTGVYGGVFAAVNSTKTDTTDYWCWSACDAPETTDTMVSAGLTLGYNRQINTNFVIGVEADIATGSSSTETIFEGSRSYEWSTDMNFVSTLRGRAGLTVDRTFLFVSGGLALADTSLLARSSEGNEPGYRANYKGTLTGMVTGAGVEHAFSDKLSFKVEYLHADFGKKRACYGDEGDNFTCHDNGNDTDDSVHWTPSVGTIRVGLNRKF